MVPAWNPMAGWLMVLLGRSNWCFCRDGPVLSHLKSEREEQVLVPLDEIRALLC